MSDAPQTRSVRGEPAPSPDGAAMTGASGGAKPRAANRKPASQPLSLQLVACLVELCRWAERPRSAEALMTGLPSLTDELERDLATLGTAAERAGFAVKPFTRKLTSLDTACLPLMVLLDSGPVLVMAADGDRVTIRRPGHDGQPTRQKDIQRASLARWQPLTQPLSLLPQADWENMASGSSRTNADHAAPRHWFWGPVLENRWLYAQVALASLIINLFALASPLFLMNVYDRVLPNGALETGWALGLGALVVFSFDFLLRNLRAYFIDIAGQRADLKLASRLYDQILDVRLDQVQGRSSGALANILREFEVVREFFTSASLAAIVDLPFVLLFLFVIYLIGGGVVLGLAFVAIMLVLISLALQVPLRRLIARKQLIDDNRLGLMVETLSGLETIRSTGADRRLRARYAEMLAESASQARKSRFWTVLGVNAAQFMQQTTSVIVVLVGMYLVTDGILTVGGLIGCIIMGSRAIAPLGQIAQLASRYQQARHALKGLNRLMAEPVERPPGTRFLHRPRLEGRFDLERVSYGYPGNDRLVLQDISLSIQPGEKIGLVGRVGSGKSTLSRLLTGLSQPAGGLIRIDGTDIGQIDPADIRRNIALVPQETYLFRGSLRDNIVIGQPDADDEAILAAAVSAGVHDFAARHPRGYDMPIGERGVGLSGGQRQAVALARALLGGAGTLILDEATNAMDTQGEQALVQRLKGYLGQRTLIMITHRQHLLALVDRLVVLDHGQIVADGPREQVLAALGSGQIKAAGTATTTASGGGA